MPPAYSAHLQACLTRCNLPLMSKLPSRVIIPMPSKLLEQIDDFRFANRLPSRAEAIRQLVKLGLKQAPKSNTR